jgi:predicted nucleotide-binding protein
MEVLMVRRPNKDSEVAPKQVLSPLDIQRGIERLQQRIADIEAFDINLVRSADNPPELRALSTSIERTLAKIFGENTADYRRYASAAKVAAIFYGVSDNYPRREHFVEQIQKKLPSAKHLLQEAVNTLQEELSDLENDSAPLALAAASEVGLSRKVFVVHGHDHGAKAEMARFLEKIDLQAIILHEQPDQGFTIIEKFETYAKQVAFAVVLLTPDDLGGAVSAPAQATRARQNVIFELGYFVGKLGRGRACLLRKGDVEIPSDLYGVIYTDMDTAEGWKLKLVKELKAAGLHFDANKVLE